MYMVKWIVCTVMLSLVMNLSMLSAVSAQSVEFRGAQSSADGNSVLLKGDLSKPSSQGPFPAVVMLHGCFGLDAYKTLFDQWSARFTRWGYVALQLDSFGSRGERADGECVRRVSPEARARDAFDAKAYLSELPFVDHRRIAVIGWSHGGWSLFPVVNGSAAMTDADPFQAAVAVYPYCQGAVDQMQTPLLILIGEKDDWTPAALCRSKSMSANPADSITFIEYPHARHCFDIQGADRTFEGHRLLYDETAARDSVNQIRDFLAKHLN